MHDLWDRRWPPGGGVEEIDCAHCGGSMLAEQVVSVSYRVLRPLRAGDVPIKGMGSKEPNP
jgi:hypothetical protein